MYFDSHAHFEEDAGPDGYEAQIERAIFAGVTGILAVGGSKRMNDTALAAAQRFPTVVRAAVGYDRTAARTFSCAGSVRDAIRDLRETIMKAREKGIRVTAIGETGLDHHYDIDTAEAQRLLFKAHLGLAAEMRLPVIVHCREAEDAVLDDIREFAGGKRFGILHCFTGSEGFAERLCELGFYISFSGMITFKRSEELRAVAAGIPADRLLVETDSPYLAPAPYRGKPNEPAFLPEIVKVMARVRGLSVEETAFMTSDNARRMLG